LPLRSFVETANFLVGLDCVISVDTAICHLAGSLGVPTLTLLRCTADAKWGYLDTTPLYPSMRLIRQRTPGDWLGVAETVRDALNARL
jgi:ADP-heptose:LPS heptosyltransferase